MCAHSLQIMRAVYWNNFLNLPTFPYFTWGSIVCIWWNRQGNSKLQILCVCYGLKASVSIDWRHLDRTFLYRTWMSWLICTICQLVSMTLEENKMPYFHVTCQSSSCLLSCPSLLSYCLCKHALYYFWYENVNLISVFIQYCYISLVRRSFCIPIFQNMIFTVPSIQ